MQPSEALSASAQLAVALAGFAGVIVAFRNRSVHEWSKIDKFRLRILLSNSALPFTMSIFAMLLLATRLPEQTTWRWVQPGGVYCDSGDRSDFISQLSNVFA
jgi:NhaP-type Na+/H+ or K+/H+ antiporter